MELKHLQSWIVAIAVIFGVSAITALPSLERLHGLDIDALHWLRENIAPAHSSPASSPTVIVAIDEQTYVTPPFIGLPKVMWTQQIGKVQSAVLGGGAAAFGWDII
ncbi:MAG: adenylate/guanylate cyclase domain-containing protein, partial [Alphaproteobacteria bacterium]